MAQPAPHPLPEPEREKYLGRPHEERWEALKPVIIKLYTGKYGQNGKSTTRKDLIALMKTHYAFHAAENEYHHHFNKWKVSKRVVKDDMAQLTNALGRRKRDNATTSGAFIIEGDREKYVEPKKLKRYLKNRSTLPSGTPLTLPPGLLFSYNLPYAAFVRKFPKDLDKPSPFGPGPSTPENIKICSHPTPSPGHVARAPSPITQLVRTVNKIDLASLFLRGKQEDLLTNMLTEDRITMVNYFHDLYLHGFIMAKYWGREVPRDIVVPAPAAALSPSGLPSSYDSSPITTSSPAGISSTPNSRRERGRSDPTPLCRWAIHMSNEHTIESGDPTDVTPSHLPSQSFEESLRQSFISNDFTSTPAENLPLATEAIVELVGADKTTMAVDAWRLAIMSGNFDLLDQLADQWHDDVDVMRGVAELHPLHIAAAFLDGSQTCCLNFDVLCNYFPPFKHNTDALGHTILDALMVSVLRSHTQIDPRVVSHGFGADGCFPGEDKDICGRWDADTTILRQRREQGHIRIPERWKHPFCHTSAQAICHSLMVVYLSDAPPPVDALSGLFRRQCTRCGTEFRFPPLHLLVNCALHLCQDGRDGETLFGILAVAVCLLTLDVDPSVKVKIFFEDFQEVSEDQQCRHPELSAAGLMSALSDKVLANWSDALKTGWACLYETLAYAERLSQNTGASLDSSASEKEGPITCSLHSYSRRRSCYEWFKCPDSEQRIGTLWAMIQVELLTYRRLEPGDSGISDNFPMEDVGLWLRGESDEATMPLLANKMMQPHLPCGWFEQASFGFFPTASEACTTHFMNFDIYDRTSFIPPPPGLVI